MAPWEHPEKRDQTKIIAVFVLPLVLSLPQLGSLWSCQET
jgi:hypothetical protein